MNRTTAVGMYPHGVAGYGALDMAGNLYEWCANNKAEPEVIDASNTSSKALRGGAFSSLSSYARASSRFYDSPYLDYDSSGVRLVVAHILPT